MSKRFSALILKKVIKKRLKRVSMMKMKYIIASFAELFRLHIKKMIKKIRVKQYFAMGSYVPW